MGAVRGLSVRSTIRRSRAAISAFSSARNNHNQSQPPNKSERLDLPGRQSQATATGDLSPGVVKLHVWCAVHVHVACVLTDFPCATSGGPSTTIN